MCTSMHIYVMHMSTNASSAEHSLHTSLHMSIHLSHACRCTRQEADLALSDTLHGTVNVTLPGRSVTTLTY